MTTNYYIPPEQISGSYVVLPAEEAKHAGQVLRKRVGDVITAVDGVGGWYAVELTKVEKRRVAGMIRETKREVGEPEFQLTVGLGLLKNQRRFEMFVEKAVELGVSRIIPLTTARTEKSSHRTERMHKVLVAAMKQCGRSRLVQLDAVTGWDDVLAMGGFEQKFVCHEKANSGDVILGALDPRSTSALILIGPEGGFSEKEVDSAVERSFMSVSLGSRRLRAETAGIAACAGVMLKAAQIALRS
ncbi:MAG: RsmE family RNA methyltransferase [Bacteroidota bacterium]